jgi:hypothetical protein
MVGRLLRISLMKMATTVSHLTSSWRALQDKPGLKLTLLQIMMTLENSLTHMILIEMLSLRRMILIIMQITKNTQKEDDQGIPHFLL